MDFNAGDVVVLRSGSQPMTIESIGKFGYDEYLSARCQWFENKKLETGIFPLTSLIKSQPSPPPVLLGGHYPRAPTIPAFEPRGVAPAS